MRLVLLLFAAAVSVAGQNALYLDLSGTWKRSSDDRPAYAAKDFDDSAWSSVQLPWTSYPERGPVTWLRRKVELPAGTDRSRLAITIGEVAEAYELYVNGRLCAKAAGFSEAEAEVARTRTFEIPEALAASAEMTVALRLWPSRNVGYNGLWRQSRRGPYALHYQGQMPEDLGLLAARALQWRGAPRVVLGSIELLLAIVLIAFWVSDRGNPVFLWLALYLGADAAQEISTSLFVSPGSHPGGSFWRIRLVVPLRLAFLGEAAMACFGFARVGLRTGIWLGALLVFTGRASEIRLVSLGYDLIGLIVVAVAIAGWVRDRNNATVSILFTLLALLAANSVGRQFGLPTGIEIGAGLEANSGQLFSTTLSLTVCALTLVRTVRERQRLTAEAEAARALQQTLLPDAGSDCGFLTIETVYEPALEVGGDFHWRRVNPDGSLTLVVGDVSGKGTPAALLVSVAIGILRNEKSTSPAAILRTLNAGFAGHTSGGFVTCCCVRFDPDGQAVAANAGHPAPYVDGWESGLEAGLPLGVVAQAEYVEARLTGSCFTLVSDGVVEAANAKGELFGFERTAAISTRPAKEIAEAAKQWGQNDDITVVTVRRSR